MLRASCHPYTIVRPGSFDAGTGREQRIELRHGDHVDYGPVARAHVAETLVCARLTPEARGRTLELFSVESSPTTDWAVAFDALARPDTHQKPASH